MKQPVILAVDDSPEVLDIIKGALSKLYAVKLATRGDVALKIAQTQHLDLILLDVMMPGMNGYETCIALKENPETSDIPVMMLSAKTGENDELLGLQAGAVDYINKPTIVTTLLARVAHQIELVLTRRALHEAHKKLYVERETMALLVHKMRNDCDFDEQYIRFSTRSEEINNGDVLLAAFRPDGCQHVIVGDFTGHGLPAAIGVPLVTYIFYARTREGVVLENILKEINLALIQMLPVNIFMGALAVEVNQQRTQAKIWNYGMESILVLDLNNVWSHLASKSLALGIDKSNKIDAHYDLTLNPKTYIYLLTDGMTEVSDNTINQEMYGVERLKTSLINNIQQGDPIISVLDEVYAYANAPIMFDDMTLLEIRSN